MKNKQKLNHLRSNYFKSTIKIFQMGLDSSAIAVYCYMSSCNEAFDPSVRYMSLRLHMNKNTVTRAVNTLLARNIISLLAAPRRGHTTKYEFVDPEKWVELPTEADRGEADDA